MHSIDASVNIQCIFYQYCLVNIMQVNKIVYLNSENE